MRRHQQTPVCEAPRVLTQTTSRVLEPSDLDAALAVLDREPVANAFVTARVRIAGLDPWRLGGEMWGWYEGGVLTSLCYAGANLVPICATPRAVRAFADRARRAGRRCSSVVGPAEPTAALWRLLEPQWGPAREVRAHQPLMVTDRMSDVIAPDPFVRRVRKDELETIMPACVAMFTEEVGISPLAGDGGLIYQARVAELVGAAAPSPASTPTARSSSRPRSAPRPTAPARSRASGWPPSTGGRASPHPVWRPSSATP
ncbi:hypothetical protein GCM10023238_04460 [Streptomyces heliomycini]